MRVSAVGVDCHDRRVEDQPAAPELLAHELLHRVFGDRFFRPRRARHVIEGGLQDLFETARRPAVRLERLTRPARLEGLHQVGAAHDLGAGGAHHLDRSGVDA